MVDDEAALIAWGSQRVWQLEGFRDQIMIDMVCRRVLDPDGNRGELEEHLGMLMDKERAAVFTADLFAFIEDHQAAYRRDGHDRGPADRERARLKRETIIRFGP